MIEKILKKILQEKGRVVVPGLGTLESNPISAEINQSGSIISPPNCKVEFSTMDIDLENLLPKEVALHTGIPLEEAEKNVKNFGEHLLQQAKTKGKAAIAELGILFYEKGDFRFELYDDVNLLADSYGLPKIHARPVVSEMDDVSVDEGKKTTRLSILWLGIIGIIIFGTLLTYLFGNQEIRKKLTATFASKDTTILALSDSISENAPIKGDEKIVEAKTKTDKKEEKTTSSPKEETTTSTVTTKKTSTTTNNNDIVTTKTNRYYIIVGSYADLKSAQKAMKEVREKGYPSAKVVKSDKIRVSAEDFPSKQEAEKAMEKIKKDYPNCWRLIY
ncbi:MAG: SPOR domain-containing protein [Flammeovirgaceae bacterium]|nr:SPOR domain-containing protein [Flammeovirgaceae bacterium]